MEENNGMPLSMQMALAHNTAAMRAFLKLDDAAQNELMDRARKAPTKREIQQIVDGITQIRLD